MVERGKQGPMEWERLSSQSRSITFAQHSYKEDFKPYEESIMTDDTDMGDPIKVEDTSLDHINEIVALQPKLESKNSISKTLESKIMTDDSPALSPKLGLFALFPYTVLGYIQLIFHAFIITLFISVIYAFGSTLYHDYDLRLRTKIAEAVANQQECLLQYRMNQCRDNPLPALQQLCQSWKDCAEQDTESLYRMPIILELLSEWLNLFLERLSYKSMLLLAASLFLLSLFTNAVFSLAKSKALFQNNKIQF
jgi:hypothetical protein